MLLKDLNTKFSSRCKIMQDGLKYSKLPEVFFTWPRRPVKTPGTKISENESFAETETTKTTTKHIDDPNTSQQKGHGCQGIHHIGIFYS